mgnify:CR=1 FL=1
MGEGIPLSAWGGTKLTGALRFKDGKLQQAWERSMTRVGEDHTKTWTFWRDVPSVEADTPDGEDGRG